MSVEVKQSDRDRAGLMMIDIGCDDRDYRRIVSGEWDSHTAVQGVADARHQAEEAIIRAADKWLAMQYGLRPLSADLAAIRSIDTRGE